MIPDLPDRIRVIVIGGGVMGSAVAWQLTRMGCEEVLVVEHGRLGCGTTWHSAGNVIRMSADPLTVEVFSESAKVISELHQRHDVGWRQCGRVMLARTRKRLQQLEAMERELRRQGVAAEPITPAEVVAKFPLMNVDDIVGALWSPGDGRVDPTGLTNAYVREARSRGAVFCEGIEVKRVLTEGGRVSGIESGVGVIGCEVVVNCAGMWARALGQRNLIDIPLYPVEHCYALTESIDGTDPHMPTFRDPDGLIYGREEVGGLLIGCFDRNAVPLRMDDLPKPFEFALLNENWDQFLPYMEQGIHRIPALMDCGIRSLVNGPESFTPDGEAFLDEAPGIKNYFVLAGLCSSGVTRSGGLAGILARWIVDGRPVDDVRRFSLQRFGPAHNQEDYLRRQVRDVPSTHFASGH